MILNVLSNLQVGEIDDPEELAKAIIDKVLEPVPFEVAMQSPIAIHDYFLDIGYIETRRLMLKVYLQQ